MAIFEKDEQGWLNDNRWGERKGKFMLMEVSLEIKETQDSNAKDSSVEYNKYSMEGGQNREGKLLLAANPVIRVSEFNEENKEKCIQQGLRVLRKRLIMEIDNSIKAYLFENYPDVEFDPNVDYLPNQDNVVKKEE